MELFVARLFDGLANGSTYALIALALVMIYKATTLINFAQGEMGTVEYPRVVPHAMPHGQQPRQHRRVGRPAEIRLHVSAKIV